MNWLEYEICGWKSEEDLNYGKPEESFSKVQQLPPERIEGCGDGAEKPARKLLRSGMQ